jgi:hypothetical protein
MFSGAFIAEEVDGLGDQGSGAATMLGAQTFLEAFFEHVPVIFLFH